MTTSPKVLSGILAGSIGVFASIGLAQPPAAPMTASGTQVVLLGTGQSSGRP